MMNPDVLRDLAREYHQRTEAYDRTVCTGPVTADGVMPVGPVELGLINSNARVVLRELQAKATSMGHTTRELQKAIGSFSCNPA